MSDRPHCLGPEDCAATAPGKHCRRCACIAKNKTDAMRAASSRNMRAKHQDPAFVAANRAASERRADAVRAYTATEQGRAHLAKVGAIGRERSNFVRGKRAWPQAQREAYFHLTLAKHFAAAEAHSIVAAEVPGTPEHARREIANVRLRQRLRAEREQREAY